MSSLNGMIIVKLPALKEQLCSAPILAYPSFTIPYILETDASGRGLGAVLSRLHDNGHVHLIAFASCSLNKVEQNYSRSELEILAVMWVVSHFQAYLYGQSVTVFTDHAAVKPMLETPNTAAVGSASWSILTIDQGNTIMLQMHCQGVLQSIALQVGITEGDIQVATLISNDQDHPAPIISALLQHQSTRILLTIPLPFLQEQRKDTKLAEIIQYLENGTLPLDDARARKIALQESLWMVLYILSITSDRATGKLWYQLIYKISYLRRSIAHLAHSCPECAIISGGGRMCRSPLHPIPVQRPFQILDLDIMELPKSATGNRYAIVLQDFLSNWPMIYALPNHSASRIVRLLVEEVVPFCGVPEALFSDRGTNLLSHLVQDVCKSLGIKKLNTIPYPPQCDEMVECLNHTLKANAEEGMQWDSYVQYQVYYGLIGTPFMNPPVRSLLSYCLALTVGC